MVKIMLVFDGGSRGEPGAGFGSYAVVKDNQRTITRLEFGDGMTSQEAGYDTLINALQMLIRQEKTPGDISLEIQTSNHLIINQVNGSWEAHEARLKTRRTQVVDLLRQFGTASLKRMTRDQVSRMLTR